MCGLFYHAITLSSLSAAMVWCVSFSWSTCFSCLCVLSSCNVQLTVFIPFHDEFTVTANIEMAGLSMNERGYGHICLMCHTYRLGNSVWPHFSAREDSVFK